MPDFGTAFEVVQTEAGLQFAVVVFDPPADEVDLLWQAFLRRFDIEHTFRMPKQTLGWTRPKMRDPRRTAGRH